MVKQYIEKGYSFVSSICDTLEETITWAKAIKAKKIVIVENNKLEEREI